MMRHVSLVMVIASIITCYCGVKAGQAWRNARDDRRRDGNKLIAKWIIIGICVIVVNIVVQFWGTWGG